MREPDRWETVHTVNDFYDAPRRGVADLDGAPHVYSWIDRFEAYGLAPVDPAALGAILEDWAIWSRWETAFHAGTLAPADRHPALAIDRPRHEVLAPVVARGLRADGGRLMQGEFRGTMRPMALEVRWFPLSNT
ncbi:MAG: hypothetical protein EON89_03450 [Brevundimonas sp.]|nr:MAG: hypothetical protein EON89_03450 [Brevundimonas sp.]